MIYTFKYEGHDIRFQHVYNCVQLLIDGALIDEQMIAKSMQWDDYELKFKVSLEHGYIILKYGVHMGVFHDTITITVADKQIAQYTVSVRDYLCLRTKTY